MRKEQNAAIGMLKLYKERVPHVLEPEEAENGDVVYRHRWIGEITVSQRGITVKAAGKRRVAYMAEAHWESLGKRKRRAMLLERGEVTYFRGVSDAGDSVTLEAVATNGKLARIDVLLG